MYTKLYKKIIAILLVETFWLSQLVPVGYADYDFVQSDWSQGASPTGSVTLTEPTTSPNPIWKKYKQKDAAVTTTVGSLALSKVAATPLVDDTDTDFNVQGAVLDGLAVVGTGASAKLQITQTANDPFYSSLGHWENLPHQPALTFGSAYCKKGDIIYALWSGWSVTTTFAEWDINTEKWTFLEDFPASIGSGYYSHAAMCYPYTGDTIYVLRGSGTKEFWSYTVTAPQGSRWQKLAPIPEGVGWGCALAGVAINPQDSKSYIYAMAGRYSSNIYRYDIAAKSWSTTPIATAPWSAYEGASLVYPETGNYLYYARGANQSYFAKYDIVNGTWTILYSDTVFTAPMPYIKENYESGTFDYDAILVYTGQPGYLYGINRYGGLGFFRFNLSTEKWDRDTLSGYNNLPPLPLPNYWGRAHLYYKPGTNPKICWMSPARYIKPFSFDLNSNKWDEPACTWSLPSWGSRMAFDGTDTVYYCAGGNGNRFMKYTISTNKWEVLNNVPFGIYVGGGILYFKDKVWAWQGSYGTNFACYDTTTGLWNNPTAPKSPSTVLSGPNPVIPVGRGWYWGGSCVAVTLDSQDYIYTVIPYDYNSVQYYYFWRYNIATDTWERTKDGVNLAQPPQYVWDGGQLLYPGTGDFIYATRGYGNTTFWRYSLSQNQWYTGLPNIPIPLYGERYQDTMVYSASDNSIYWLRSTDYWPYTTFSMAKYTIDSNPNNPGTWVRLNNKPFGGISSYVLAGNYIYGLTNWSWGMYRYDLTTGTWDKPQVERNADRSSFQGGGIYYGQAVLGPDNDTVYLMGNDTTNSGYATVVWKYSLSQKKWLGFLDAPFFPYYGTSACYPGTDGNGNSQYVYVLEGRQTPYLWRLDTTTETWTQMADAITAGGTRYDFYVGAQMAGSGDNIYVIRGWFDGVTKTFLRYNISSNTWSKLTDIDYYVGNSEKKCLVYPGGQYVYYAGAGYPYDNMFMVYDINQNKWLPPKVLPISMFDYSALVYTGNALYASYGNSLYKYDFAVGEWSDTPLANVPFHDIGFTFIYPGSGDIIYAIGGNRKNDFMRYSISANTWDQPVSMPYYAYYGADVVALEDTLFYRPGGGTSYGGNLFYKYSISGRTWTQVSGPKDASSNPLYADEWSARVTTDGKDFIYATKGRSRPDIWKYSIAEDKWYTNLQGPNPGGALENFGTGHDLCYKNGYVYVLKGESTKTFWRYNPIANSWKKLADINIPSGSVSWGGRLVVGDGDYIYCVRGDGSSEFYRYTIDIADPNGLGTWTKMPDMPVFVAGNGYDASALCYPGFGDYIYFIPGGIRSYVDYDGATKTFYRYSISKGISDPTNAWQEIESLPAPSSSNISLVYPGTGNYLYGSMGNNAINGPQTEFWRYLALAQGTYTSSPKEVGNNAGFKTITWVDNTLTSLGRIAVRVRTSNSPSMAGALSWDRCPIVKSGDNLSTASPTSVIAGHRYIQYRVTLVTDCLDPVVRPLPSLDRITINYDTYTFKQELVSSPIGSSFLKNRITKLSWKPLNQPLGSDARFQIRTSTNKNDLLNDNALWLGPGGTQTFTDDYSNQFDYKFEQPAIEVVEGVARLQKVYQTFQYTQRIVFDNSLGTTSYTNSVFSIEVTAKNKDFWGHVRSDGADVRFVDSAGNSLPYNLHANGAKFDYANKYAKIFVKVTSVPAGQKTNICLKYGYTGVDPLTSASDPNVTDVPRTNLVGYWRFDDGDGGYAIDSSEYGNDGLLGGTVGWIDGKIGRALNFNGGSSDYITVPNTGVNYSVLKNNATMSISCWFRQNNTSTKSGLMRRFNGCSYGYENSVSVMQYGRLAVTYVDSSGSYRTITSKTDVIQPNVWYHMVVTVEAGVQKLYVNGQLIATTNFPRQLYTSNTDSLLIGTGYTIEGTAYQSGAIDEIVMYNRSLTAGEVQQLYAIGNPVPYYFYSLEENLTLPESSQFYGWGRRMTVRIDNTKGGALTNYQIKIPLDKAQEGFWAYCNSDGSDIRFSDSDGETELSYWREAYSYANKTATLWVKLPKIEAGELKTIYLYYQNSEASEGSVRDDTMAKDFDEMSRNVSAIALDGAGSVRVNHSVSLNLTSQVTIEAQLKYDVEYWPENWPYRQKVTLNNAGGSERVNALAQFDVPYQAGMRADYLDLRFFETDHSRKLRYKITASDVLKATVWVEVPIIPANRTKDIYVYYGNASAIDETDNTLYTDVIQDSSLVGWWKFDSIGTGGAVQDSSGRNNTCYLSNNPQLVSGKFGPAVQFNGTSQYGTANNSSSLQVTGDMTIAWWMNASNAGVGGKRINPIDKSYGGEFAFTIETNRAITYFHGHSRGGNDYWSTNYPADSVVNGQWQHFALVRDTATKTVTAYVNGVVVRQAVYNPLVNPNPSYEPNPSTYPVVFARGYTGDYLAGLIDQATIYNRALSIDEVKRLVFAKELAIFASPVFAAQETEAAGLQKWFPGFGYRKRITLNNTGKAEWTNTEIQFDVNLVAGKMKADYSDVRFVDTDGKKLKYNVKNIDVPNNKATFSVKIPSVPANSYKDIYMYYGNTNAANESDASLKGTVAFGTEGKTRVAFYNHFRGSHPTNDMELNVLFTSYITSMINTDFLDDDISGTANRDYYCSYVQGFIYAPTAGTYSFGIDGDDAVELRMGSNLEWNKRDPKGTVVCSWYGAHGTSGNFAAHQGDIFLEAGWNPFVLRHEEIGGGDSYSLGWKMPGAASFTSISPTYIASTSSLFDQPGLSSAMAVNLTSTFAAEEMQPAINKTILSKPGTPGAYELKLTQNGLTATVNTTSVSTVSYELGKFTHVAMAYDGSKVYVLVDGAEKASTPLTGPISTNSSIINIGSGIKGAIDEIRIWNKARTAAEVYGDQKKALMGDEIGLVAYLKFNENTGIAADDSAKNNDGTLQAGATWYQRPFPYSNEEPQAAYHFDEGIGIDTFDVTKQATANPDENKLTLTSGATWQTTDLTGFSNQFCINLNNPAGGTAYLQATNSASLGLTNAITIEAWIKPKTGQVSKQVILEKGDGTTNGNYSLYLDGNFLVSSFYSGGWKTHTATTAGIDLSGQNIYYVVATFDEAADEIRIYVNGSQKYFAKEQSALVTNSNNLFVGKSASATTPGYFNGLIDEIRIYNRPLSVNEITAHYQHRKYAYFEPEPLNFFDFEPDVSPLVGSYAKNNPVAQPIMGVFYSGKNIFEFAELPTTQLPGTAVKYQISKDGYKWYWYNSNRQDGDGDPLPSAWEEATGGYSQTSPATEVNARLADFQNNISGEGEFYYRAYLHSDETSFNTPVLDNIAITLKTGETFYTDPNGSVPINTQHTNAQNDEWFQYKVILYTAGPATLEREQLSPYLEDVTFKYVDPDITLTTPAGNETFNAGQAIDIIWTSRGIQTPTGNGTVKLEYSINNGANFYPIAAGVVSTTSPTTYHWNIPLKTPTNQLIHSDNALIKITSEDLSQGGFVFSTTSNLFRILSLNISSPNGGEEWELDPAGTMHHMITWSSSPNATPPVRIYLDTDGSRTYPTLITTRNNITPAQFDWVIDGHGQNGNYSTSDTCRIKIVDSSATPIFDESNATFRIMPKPTITISQPDISARWVVGTSHNITWTLTGNVSSNLVVEYSVEGGAWTAVQPAPTPAQISAKLYPWNVPDIIGSNTEANVQVRIRETTVPSGRDTSTPITGLSASFKVATPTITLNSYPLGTVWVAGDKARTFSWANSGSLVNPLVLEYGIDADASGAIDGLEEWGQLASGFPHGATSGSYTWSAGVAAGASGDNVYFRISDSRNPTKISDITDTPITVLPYKRVTMTAPATGEVLVNGQDYTIAWIWDGQPPNNITNNLVIDLYVDGIKRRTVGTQISSTPSTYPWTVFNDIEETTNAQLYIYDSTDANVHFETGAFTISLPKITIDAPKPPNNQWYAKGVHNIQWSTQGAVSSNISIKYSLNGGAFVPVSPSPTPAQVSAKSYPWRLPDSPGGNNTIKITDEDRPAVNVTSDPFTIIAPSLEITAPKTATDSGDKAWVIGTDREIKWIARGKENDAISGLKFYYSINNGPFVSFLTLLKTDPAFANQLYTWTVNVPNIAAKVKAKIKIEDPQRTATTITSEEFDIAPPTTTVTSPIGGEFWKIGTDHNIIWYTVGSIQYPLKLFYAADGKTWVEITAADGFDGYGTARPELGTTYRSFTWNVADAYAAGTVKMKVIDSYATARETITKPFTIAYPTVTVDTPTQLWSVTDTRDVTWSYEGKLIGPMKVEWSKDNFVTAPITIGTVDKTVTLKSWYVPTEAASGNVKLRVNDMGRLDAYGDSLVQDDSDAFTILPEPDLTITAPSATNIGEDGAWRIGKYQDITWYGIVGNISGSLTLYYATSSDGGTTWGAWQVVDNTDTLPINRTPLSYTWQVPLTLSPCKAKIKIKDNISWRKNPEQFFEKESDPFDVYKPRIIFVNPDGVDENSPDGKEYWAIDESPVIQWQNDGFVHDDISIQLVIGTHTYPVVSGLSSGWPDNGYYTWHISDVLAYASQDAIVNKPARLKITDLSANYGGATVEKLSEEFFIVPKPTIQVTAPNGGATQIYALGDNVPITWKWQGISISNNLIIDYSADDFTTTKIIATSVANTGSHTWKIPDDALTGPTVKIRIRDGNRTEIGDTSDGYFRIRGSFEVQTPNGNESWVAKSSQAVTWKTRGTIPRVKLEYSLDGGATWSYIETVNNPTSTGSYSWSVPDLGAAVDPKILTTAKIRISDPNDSDIVYDTSDSNFTILYASVTFSVQDYDSMEHLEKLAVNEPSTGWQVQVTPEEPEGLHSPITRTLTYPYGSYTTFFDKEGFIPSSVTWIPPRSQHATDVYKINVTLENAASAQVTWETIMTYSFSPASDTLSAVGSLQRKGKLVGTYIEEKRKLGPATLTIYEPDGKTIKYLLSANPPVDEADLAAWNGMYNFLLANTGFESGLVYPATLCIEYGNQVPKLKYISSTNIDVGMEILQYDFFTKTATQLAASVETIKAAVATSTTELKSDLTTARQAIQADTGQILTATQKDLPAQLQTSTTQIQDLQRSEILNRENTIRATQTLMLRYRTYSGLHPAIDLYDSRNTQRINKAVMTEIGSTGIYEYAVTFSPGWGYGDFTIVCSESTKGTLDALIISVLKTDMEQIYNQVSAVLGSTSGIGDLRAVADSLNSQFSIIETALSKVGKDLVKEVKDAASSATALETVYNQLAIISKEIRGISGDNGLTLSKLYEVSSEKKQDITYLKNKTQQLKATMELNQKMIDNIANKPVTQTWYEYN